MQQQLGLAKMLRQFLMSHKSEKFNISYTLSTQSELLCQFQGSPNASICPVDEPEGGLRYRCGYIKRKQRSLHRPVAAYPKHSINVWCQRLLWREWRNIGQQVGLSACSVFKNLLLFLMLNKHDVSIA